MSTYFNYKRAWHEYVKPQFDAISPVIGPALEITRKNMGTLEQNNGQHALRGVTPEILAAFEALDTATLAVASQVVYFYGHLAPDRSCQEGGLYWKFKILADSVLANRKGAYGPDSPCDNAKRNMDQALKNFYDHEEGTEYSDEEIPGYLLSHYPTLNNDVVTIERVVHVNYKPDVFCIGPKHIQLSPGMYLDPNVAPCATCGKPYSSHTSERALVLKVKPSLEYYKTPENNPKLAATLTSIKDACASLNIKVDGFTFIQ